MAPMHYPTHSPSGPIGVMNAHAVKVCAWGCARGEHRVGRLQEFGNETALFHMSNDATMRICEHRVIGHRGREMFRVYRLLNQEYEVPAKILELNRRHPLIRNLAQMVADSANDPVIEAAIEQMYENQLLIDGLHPNPSAMIPRLQKLMEAATRPRETQA